MNSLPARVRAAMLLRSLAVQGSWNYQTLIGTGFAFALLPALRHRFRGDPDAFRAAVARHTELFNSHPYLVPLAAGAVARLEADGVPAATVQRFKTALRASLGSVGDQLVWSSWRPMCALLGLAILLAGAPWWLAISLFLGVYNLLHVALRIWGLRIGWAKGLQVARAVREAPLARIGTAGHNAAALFAGLCGGLMGLWVAPTTGALLPVLGGAVVGWVCASRARGIVAMALLLMWLLGFFAGIVPNIGL